MIKKVFVNIIVIIFLCVICILEPLIFSKSLSEADFIESNQLQLTESNNSLELEILIMIYVIKEQRGLEYGINSIEITNVTNHFIINIYNALLSLILFLSLIKLKKHQYIREKDFVQLYYAVTLYLHKRDGRKLNLPMFI